MKRSVSGGRENRSTDSPASPAGGGVSGGGDEGGAAVASSTAPPDEAPGSSLTMGASTAGEGDSIAVVVTPPPTPRSARSPRTATAPIAMTDVVTAVNDDRSSVLPLAAESRGAPFVGGRPASAAGTVDCALRDASSGVRGPRVGGVPTAEPPTSGTRGGSARGLGGCADDGGRGSTRRSGLSSQGLLVAMMGLSLSG